VRILLFGGTGQVGHELQRALAPLGDVSAPNRAAADFSDPERLTSLVATAKPDVVVNAVAYTAVDRAESEPDVARTINAIAPGVLAAAAEQLGAILVHYSTDYVFDGAKDGWYDEADAPAPLSAYGRTKLAGERAVQTGCSRHLILRTSWVFGTHGQNFARTMLRLAATRDTLRVVDDQHGAPTSAATIAGITGQVLLKTRDLAHPWGLYHLAASGETTWCGYARHLVQGARQRGVSVRASPESVLPISTAEYPTPARRPRNSRLNTSRLRDTFGVRLPKWTTGVDQFLDHVATENPHE
jgi:dTDP-4-dehydrorhamnose reductase